MTPLLFWWTDVLTKMKGTQMRIFLISLLLVLLATISKAEAPDHLDPDEAFQLWTGCQPVGVVVGLNKGETEINLTEEKIEAAVRSRLRSARLYAAEGSGVSIIVLVDVLKIAFNIDVAFQKFVSDVAFSEQFDFGTTWMTGGIGIHSYNANFILSSISQYIDEFLDEYLRVNADAC